MKKILLILIFILNFTFVPANADEVVTNITTTQEEEEVSFDVPSDLPQGFHSAAVDLTDPDTGEVTTQEVFFCKDSAGEIQWDNQCLDLAPVVDPATLEEVKDVKDLPTYSPISEPEKTAEAQVAGFTALSVLSVGGAVAAASGAVSAGVSGTSTGSGTSGASGGATRGGGTSSSGSRPSGGGEARRPDENEDTLAVFGASNDADGGDGGRGSGGDGRDGGGPSSGVKSKRKNSFDLLLDQTTHAGLGDMSITWRAPFTQLVDSTFLTSSIKSARLSPLFAKILLDASYLRAMVGSISILAILFGLFIGFQSLISSHAQPMPPSWTLMAAMAILALFDSFAGLLSTLIFVVGVLVSGNVDSLSHVLTIFTYAAICASPAIMAGSFRPLRRRVGRSEHLWERGIDYVLAALLTGWTVSKFIGVLNIIAAKQLPIAGHASEIGIAIGIAVIIRMVLEDISTYLYPQRVSQLSLALPQPPLSQQYISLLLKAGVFALIMTTFVGFNLQLLFGTIFFILPNILKLSTASVLPKSRVVNYVIPKGAIRIVAMTVIGTLFAALSKSIFTNPRDFITWGFVLLSLPSFVFSMLELISNEQGAFSLKNGSRSKWVYRFGGVGVLYLITQIVIGKDIVELIKQLFGVA
jgi:hypothetical protein